MPGRPIEQFTLTFATGIVWRGETYGTHRPGGLRAVVCNSKGEVTWDSLDCYDRANCLSKIGGLLEELALIVRPSPSFAWERRLDGDAFPTAQLESVA